VLEMKPHVSEEEQDVRHKVVLHHATEERSKAKKEVMKEKDEIKIKSNGLRNELKEIRKSIDKLTDAIKAQTHAHYEKDFNHRKPISWNEHGVSERQTH